MDISMYVSVKDLCEFAKQARLTGKPYVMLSMYDAHDDGDDFVCLGCSAFGPGESIELDDLYEDDRKDKLDKIYLNTNKL